MDAFTSRDGARIAYERSGSGPSLVLIHGGWADHTSWSLVVPTLAEHFTVYAVDRRGCGQSDPYGDEYEMEQDFQDVAAVVDAVGTSVNLVGHSIGGFCALHGALLTPNVRRLVVYEPPLGGPETIQDAVVDRIEALIAAGDRDQAAVVFGHEVVGVPLAEIEQQRASPTWAARVAGVHAIPPGMRALLRFHFEPERLRGLTVPTLLLVGSESTPYHKGAVATVAAALPNAQVAVLPSQQHSANVTAPDLLATQVLDFLTAETPILTR
jgi:pimeloyl-ACP methyl ester carboxylesterase